MWTCSVADIFDVNKCFSENTVISTVLMQTLSTCIVHFCCVHFVLASVLFSFQQKTNVEMSWQIFHIHPCSESRSLDVSVSFELCLIYYLWQLEVTCTDWQQCCDGFLAKPETVSCAKCVNRNNLSVCRVWYNFNKNRLRSYSFHQIVIQRLQFWWCKDVAKIWRVSPQWNNFLHLLP